jgi:hypothetical protein
MWACGESAALSSLRFMSRTSMNALPNSARGWQRSLLSELWKRPAACLAAMTLQCSSAAPTQAQASPAAAICVDKETLGADGNPMGVAFVAGEGSSFALVIVPVGAHGAMTHLTRPLGPPS